MFSLNLKGGAPIYEQLTERITELISTGVMAGGEKLPAVREVAKELGVNPNTVQKSYQALEQKGLIYSIPAKGSYVTESAQALETIRARAIDVFIQSIKSALRCGVTGEILSRELENSLRGEIL